jgi:hypothetical protein
MLISHKHRFIFFIHIYKNAGTSIMTALSPYAFYNPFHQWVYKISSRIGLRHKIPLDFNPQPVPPHSSAKQIAAEIGFEKFKSYFSCNYSGCHCEGVFCPKQSRLEQEKPCFGRLLHSQKALVRSDTPVSSGWLNSYLFVRYCPQPLGLANLAL